MTLISNMNLHGMRLIDMNGLVVVQTRMSLNGIYNCIINLLTVSMNLRDGWPEHVVLVHIVPEHLIDTNFKNGFKISVHRLVQYSRDAEFVNVKTRRMTIVKDLGVAKAMRRGAAD